MLIYLSPDEKLLPALESYRAECLAAGDGLDGAAGLGNFPDLRDWLRRARLLSSSEAERNGWIRTEIFLAAEMPEGCSIAARRQNEGTFLPAIVGTFNIRIPQAPSPDGEDPLRFAGHIGYHVRPSQRGKGSGTALLRRATAVCRAKGIARPFVCAEEDNVPSLRAASSCGYVLQERAALPDGTAIVRMRIPQED